MLIQKKVDEKLVNPPLCNDIMVLVEIVDIAQIIKMESLHASRKWFYSEFFFIELSKFMMKATT